MRVTVQRVLKASCIVNNEIISTIGPGLLLLIGFTSTDTFNEVEQMTRKIVNLRIFEDELGKMNHSINSIKGEILAISQFTLYADTDKGNRPSFINSMTPQLADELYQKMIELLNNKYEIITKAGSFGAHMYLDVLCDGPVTINLEF